MNIQQELELNMFGQNLLDESDILETYSTLNILSKHNYLNHLVTLILQSKPIDGDIENAIKQSTLKETFTPCILLKNGIKYNTLKRIINLPENELKKSLILLLNLFKIAYQRRFKIERNSTSKWWYWDFSENINIQKIHVLFFNKITLEHIRIYEKYNGDGKGFVRSATQIEVLIMRPQDWSLIDSLIQDIHLAKNGLISKEYINKLLLDNCENEAVIMELNKKQ